MNFFNENNLIFVAYIQRALDQTGTLKEAADVLGISFSSLCRKKQSLAYPKIQVPAKKLPAMPFKNLKGMTGFLMTALLIIPLPVLSSHHLLFRFFLPCKHCCHRKEGIIFISFHCIYQCLCNAVRNSPDVAVFQTLEAAFDSRADSLFDLLQKWI